MLKVTTIALLAISAVPAGVTETVTKVTRTPATCSPPCKGWEKCGSDGTNTKCFPAMSPCKYFASQGGFTACTSAERCSLSSSTSVSTLKAVAAKTDVECKATTCSATCTSNQVCKAGTCTAVTIASFDTLSDDEKTTLRKSGVDLSTGFTKVRALRPDATGADKIESTTDFTIVAGEVADVEGTVTLQSLQLAGTDAQPSLVNMKANSKVTLSKLAASSGSAAKSEIVFQRAAETKITLAEVGNGKKTRLALADAETKTKIDAFDLKSATAVLECAGKGLVDLTNANKDAATQGKIEARGGVRLKGDIGKARLVIEANEEGTEEAEAEVEGEFTIGKDVEGSGKLKLLKAEAKAKIKGTKNVISAKLEMAKGEIDMSESNELVADTLAMTGGKARFKTKKKGATKAPFVKTIESCGSAASMEFEMDTIQDFTTGKSESLLMTETSKSEADKFQCPISVKFTDGTTKKVNMGTALPAGITEKTFTTGGGRRLLQTGSDLCGSWTGSSLEVATGSCAPSGTSSAATASASLAVLAIAVGLLY